jgi:hypothetical protein
MYSSGRCYLILATLVAISAMLLCAGCGHGLATSGPWFSPGPSNISISAPVDMHGNTTSNWTVAWTSDKAPFTVAWNFGDGATPNTVEGTATTLTHATIVTMVNPSATEPAHYTVTVTIIDAKAHSKSATLDYTVGPALHASLVPVIIGTPSTARKRALSAGPGGVLNVTGVDNTIVVN